jgi:KamA family protein
MYIEPLEDEKYTPVAGLVHKYPNRVLLITSRVCAIHCQYCFRQNFNYTEHDAISNYLAIEEYICSHSQINEVILSGGDPLSLSDEKLAQLIGNIEKISHIKNLRIHTRSAVVTPSRITTKLIKLLNQSTLIIRVIFINEIGKFQRNLNRKTLVLKLLRLKKGIATRNWSFWSRI